MINLEDYKSGTLLKGDGDYTYFLPAKINEQWTWQNQQINKLSEQAATKLGHLTALANIVPNVDLFIRLHVTKEAVSSNRIEGTQTEIDEALLSIEDIALEKKDDWQEVNNYIDSMNNAINSSDKLPISSRLIKNTHRTLLSSVRGQHKKPGEYRTSQNWIGGNSPSDAKYTPPHQQYVEMLMGDLENFLHNDKILIPEIIRIAIAHYQFETIHPFLDGNGRIGRLLITLLLIDKKLLSKPLLYISSYFEKNKTTYYEKLTLVRTKNEMQQWICYFLTAITNTAELAITTLEQIFNLKKELENQISDNFGKKTNHALTLLQYIFTYPIVNVQSVIKICGLSAKASNNLIADFVNYKILIEFTGLSRNRKFIFKQYIKLFE